MKAHLRVARASNDLDGILRFYRDGLGFEVIASFEDHDGFDGLMLGHPGWHYHLEFTRQHGQHTALTPDVEDLLVFYLPDRERWQAATDCLLSLGYRTAMPNNPYWQRRGVTFIDPDGYRVVLQNAAWD
jgi:catechol 2,3-dioxygenase-like lactoylglutathione lyase family enzyme